MWHIVPMGSLHHGPKRQVVSIVIRVIQKASVLPPQGARIRAVSTRVPAERRLAGQALYELRADIHLLAFGCLIYVLVVDPAPAVAGDLMAQLDEGGGHIRVAFQGHGPPEDGERKLAPLEFAQDAPHAGARAVLVDRLHGEMAGLEGLGADDLGQELFRGLVAVQHAALAAFFVVEHKLHCGPGIAWPAGVRNVAAVPDQVAGVGWRGRHGLLLGIVWTLLKLTSLPSQGARRKS